MSIRYARVMSLLMERPLFVHPRSAMTIYNALAGRFGTPEGILPSGSDDHALDSRITARAATIDHDTHLPVRASRYAGNMVRSETGGFPGTEPFMRTTDGVGIITADGEFVNRGAWVGSDMSGVVSYEGLGFQLQRAGRDPKTKAIILDMNSPGGAAMGCTEISAAVRAVASVKPVYAVSNGMMCSAAYAIGCGATRVFNTPSGMMGSIGCVMMHLDVSKALANEGVKPTFIYAGAHKIDGNSYEPLDDDAAKEMQAEVDTFYEQFIGLVAQGRGRALSAAKARATEARTFFGEDAQKNGLADGVASFEEILSECSAKIKRQSRSGPSGTRSVKMTRLLPDDEHGGGEQIETGASAAQLEADRLARKTAKAQQMHKAGFDEGFKASSDRLKTIMGDDAVKGKEAFAIRLATRSPNMSAEDVLETVKDYQVPHTAALGGDGDHGGETDAERMERSVKATGVNGIVTGIVPGTERQAGSHGGGSGQEERLPSGGPLSSWGKAVESVAPRGRRAAGNRR